MGWEDNDFDWMEDGGYSSDGGMDFGDTSDYTNNLDVTTDDYSGAWSGFGNNDYSGSSDWDFDSSTWGGYGGYSPTMNYGSNSGSYWSGSSGSSSGYSGSDSSSSYSNPASSYGGW